ncbi:Alpha/Beta hydrolase protein [Mycena latifolia]|nr:Alpha/Beta hydrolase protein [Mycena latifolia]
MSSPIIARSHCENCFTGVKHSGTAVGRTETIAGVDTYVSDPPSIALVAGAPKKVLLFLADVYGPFFINCQLMQDYFASQGFYVLGLDYFFGDPIHIHTDPEFDRMKWLARVQKEANEAFPKWLEEVRKIHGLSDSRYCFGAPFAMDLGATDNIVAAAFAHPSFLNEDHFKNLKKPLLLSCAENDFTFELHSRRRAEDILMEIKATFQFQVFSGIQHGFAIRGDPDVPDERWAKEESASGVVRWFNRFCV